jgi:hypothetical protein
LKGNALLTYFPILAIVTGIKELQYWLNPTNHKMHWWFGHMNSMFTACIATVTAFVVTAVPRLLGADGQNIFLWLAPAAILVPIFQLMSSFYKKKFNVS